ncbi:hypothetical protein ACQEVF_06185 [Nonomuraea polychroma]
MEQPDVPVIDTPFRPNRVVMSKKPDERTNTRPAHATTSTVVGRLTT